MHDKYLRDLYTKLTLIESYWPKHASHLFLPRCHGIQQSVRTVAEVHRSALTEDAGVSLSTWWKASGQAPANRSVQPSVKRCWRWWSTGGGYGTGKQTNWSMRQH